jgi:uncharacterized membrane protein
MKTAFSDAAANVPGEPKMWDHLSFVIKRLRERLWIKPLIVCVLSIGAVFLANFMDTTELGRSLPEITKDSTETLLKILASSMLMMATSWPQWWPLMRRQVVPRRRAHSR